jgi:Tfp pilus assembly protein PilW
MRATQRGATLIELLAVLVPMSLVAAGAVGFFSAHSRTQLQQDASVAMEENLRAAMGMVADTLRTAGCGAPQSNLADWITWVPGFDNVPLIVSGGGEQPATISIVA